MDVGSHFERPIGPDERQILASDFSYFHRLIRLYVVLLGCPIGGLLAMAAIIAATNAAGKQGTTVIVVLGIAALVDLALIAVAYLSFRRA